jgi:hypothetical protein
MAAGRSGAARRQASLVQAELVLSARTELTAVVRDLPPRLSSGEIDSQQT